MKTTYSNPRQPGMRLHFERRGDDLAVAVDDTVNESRADTPGAD